MRGNFRLMVVLVAVFGVLLVAVLFQPEDSAPVEVPPTLTPEPTTVFQRVYPDLEVLDIVAVRLHNPANGENFTIARRPEDGMWTAPGYPDGALDTEAASFIAQTITLMPYRQAFEVDDDTALVQYGFDPNADFFIEFVTVDGGEHIIALGVPTQGQRSYYSLVDERPEIYVIERGPVDFLVEYFVNPPVTETEE